MNSTIPSFLTKPYFSFQSQSNPCLSIDPRKDFIDLVQLWFQEWGKKWKPIFTGTLEQKGPASLPHDNNLA